MRILAVSVLALSTVSAIAADAPKTTLVRGTISALDAKSMTIKTDNGAFTAAAPLSTHFATVEKRSLGQIKPTDFVGITSVPGENGHLRAEEIHVIPLKGLGEGQYPWPHHPSTDASHTPGSMTNGTVASAAAAASSMTAPQKPATPGSMTNGTVTAGADGQLTVTYHGAQMVGGKCEGLAVPGKPGCTGKSIVDVPAKTPIVSIVPWRRDLVKPGMYVVAQAVTDASGKTVIASATVEKNGVKPEF